MPAFSDRVDQRGRCRLLGLVLTLFGDILLSHSVVFETPVDVDVVDVVQSFVVTFFAHSGSAGVQVISFSWTACQVFFLPTFLLEYGISSYHYG